jgi:hypothetical protein
MNSDFLASVEAKEYLIAQITLWIYPGRQRRRRMDRECRSFPWWWTDVADEFRVNLPDVYGHRRTLCFVP